MITRNGMKNVLTLASVALAIVGLTATSPGQTFTADKAAYAFGEDIVLTWSGQPGNPTDWMGIWVAGSPADSGTGLRGWAYTDGTTGNGTISVPNGSMTVDVDFVANQLTPADYPIPAGNYEAWFCLNDGYTKSGPMAAFTISLPPGPVATMPTPAADVSEPGGMFYSFDVLYEDDVAVDGSSIGVGDVTVTYTVIPPGGVWDPADNYSTYTSSLVAGEVLDTDGPNSAAGGTLDIFSVQVVPPYSDFSSVASCQLPVVSCQLPVVSCQLSVASCRLPVVSCRLSVDGKPGIEFRLPKSPSRPSTSTT